MVRRTAACMIVEPGALGVRSSMEPDTSRASRAWALGRRLVHAALSPWRRPPRAGFCADHAVERGRLLGLHRPVVS